MPDDADLAPASLARMIAGLLVELDLRDVTVVCNDWGSAQLVVAPGGPDRVGGLVLASCEAFDNYPPGISGRLLCLNASLPVGTFLTAQLLRPCLIRYFVDIDAAVGEAARVLCPGGRYVVVDSMSPDDPELDAFLDAVERRRDPTHVRSYRRDEWMRIIDRTGLQVERVASLRKGRSFQFWLERGGVEGEHADQLRETFRDAPDTAKECFEIQIDGDVIKSFTDDKIVIRATSPRP